MLHSLLRRINPLASSNRSGAYLLHFPGRKAFNVLASSGRRFHGISAGTYLGDPRPEMGDPGTPYCYTFLLLSTTAVQCFAPPDEQRPDTVQSRFALD